MSNKKQAVVAIIGDGVAKILVLEKLDGSYCLPDGIFKEGEDDTIVDALQRVVDETTGLTLLNAKYLSTVDISVADIFYYKVLVNPGEDITLDSTRHKSYRFMSMEEIKADEPKFTERTIRIIIKHFY